MSVAFLALYKKQNKAKALKKLNELEKVLNAEIERREAIM